jgi:serine/threonine-protein kinase
MTQDDPTHTISKHEESSFVGELTAGSLAGEYIIDGLIARGGCGAVYVGKHQTAERRAAIKVLDASLATSPRMVERFVREVEVVNLLCHPNIVTVYDIGTLPDGRPFCAMEYLGELTLDSLLQAEGRLSPEDALDILEPVCSALAAAHREGIVHRDVKASNIAICPLGERRTVKLLDFGIAKLLYAELGASGLTSAGQQLGSPSLMAPEQILGEPLDARVDIYALGVLLYKLLTGQLPFHSVNPSELARQHLEEPPPRPSRIARLSPALDAIVLRSMQKRPEHRFDSVKNFRAALRQAVDRKRSRCETIPDAQEPAVAIYLQLRAEVAEDDLDDSLAEDLGRILDIAEERLRCAGFSVGVQTSSAILAICSLSGAPEATVRKRKAALDLASSLYDELARRPAADERVVIALGLHVDQVIMHDAEVLGGPIVRTSAWAPPAPAPGVWTTPSAALGSSDFMEAESSLPPLP